MSSNPHPHALALGLMIRDMPRTWGDWTREHLTDEQYREFMHEVACTVASVDEREMARLVAEIPVRTRSGDDLSDVAVPERRRWWQRWIPSTREAA